MIKVEKSSPFFHESFENSSKRHSNKTWLILFEKPLVRHARPVAATSVCFFAVSKKKNLNVSGKFEIIQNIDVVWTQHKKASRPQANPFLFPQ